MADRKDQMELIIPSDFKFLGAVDAAVQDLAREQACTPRWINDFSTALIEACSNAIEHGNKYAKDKVVRVIIHLNGKQIKAEIIDQGPGFNHKARMANPAPTDPLSERGRGILIMQAFLDGLTYRSAEGGGTCVELTKTCEDPSSSKA